MAGQTWIAAEARRSTPVGQNSHGRSSTVAVSPRYTPGTPTASQATGTRPRRERTATAALKTAIPAAAVISTDVFDICTARSWHRPVMPGQTPFRRAVLLDRARSRARGGPNDPALTSRPAEGETSERTQP